MNSLNFLALPVKSGHHFYAFGGGAGGGCIHRGLKIITENMVKKMFSNENLMKI